MYLTAAVANAKFTDSPPDAILIGIEVALRYGVDEHPPAEVVQPLPVTLPATVRLLDASVRPDPIVVFAFCVVEKPMLRTTKARAAATITNAIITIADSTPMTPLWDCLCPFLIRFIGFVLFYQSIS